MPHLLKNIDCPEPLGGATVEWYGWIKGLLANGHEVGVLTFKGAKEYIGKDIEFDILETYVLNEGIPKLRWVYKRYPALINSVKEYNPDYIVQECAGYLTGMMAYIGKKLKIPFIYRVANDMDTDDRYKERLSKCEQIIYQYGLNNSNFIICQNNYQYEKLRRKFPEKKVTTLHNPCYYCCEELRNVKIKSNKKYIAWLGIYQYQKNLPALYEIVKSSQDIEFRIAGKIVADVDTNTKSALNLLKKCKNVKFVGFLKRTEVIPFLTSAFALLNTSHYEGFSNTFLESLLAGTPIVTTSNIDPDNIIADNNLGLIAKNYSEIPGLLSLLVKKDDYNHLSQRCIEYVLENHDPKLLAKKFIENLNE